MNNVIHLQPKNPDIYGLFANMTDNQNELNRKNNLRIFWLKQRYEWLKAAVIALTLCLIATVVGFGLAIKDFKSKPVTVLLENQVAELDKLPLPPLEELKLDNSDLPFEEIDKYTTKRL